LIRLGSSPLTRGKRHEVRGQGCAAGLIPAHAGKTGRWRSRSGVWTAHPRSRGENLIAPLITATRAGSSPLTRGKRVARHAMPCRCRLIPAHAGKTRGQESRHEGSPAHPRSRGENHQRAREFRPSSGSSPLTRGKLDATDKPINQRRLIPAHAGKTRLSR